MSYFILALDVWSVSIGLLNHTMVKQTITSNELFIKIILNW